MALSSKAVANNWIARAMADFGHGLTQLQIQKLTYIAHGFMLGATDQPLVDEEVRALQFGPVFLSLLDEFDTVGSSEITRFAETIDFETWKTVIPTIENEGATNVDKRVLDFVWEKYGHSSGPKLVSLTHSSGSPWDQVTDGGVNTGVKVKIPNELIRDYYANFSHE